MPVGMNIPNGVCLKCGHLLNVASNQSEEVPRPSPGDFTICLYCDNLMVFNDDLSVRSATEAECKEADKNEEVKEVRLMIAMYKLIYHKGKSDDGRASDTKN